MRNAKEVQPILTAIFCLNRAGEKTSGLTVYAITRFKDYSALIPTCWLSLALGKPKKP